MNGDVTEPASSLYDHARWLLRRAPWILAGGAGAAIVMALVSLAIPVVFSSHAVVDVGSLLLDPVAARRIDELNGPLNSGGFRDAFADDPALNSVVKRAWLLYDAGVRGVSIRVDATDPASAKRGADRVARFLVDLYSKIPLSAPAPPPPPASPGPPVAPAVAPGSPAAPAVAPAHVGQQLRDLAARLRKDSARPSVPEDRRLRLQLAAAFAEQAATAPAQSATLAGLRFASSSDSVIATALTPAVLAVLDAVEARDRVEPAKPVQRMAPAAPAAPKKTVPVTITREGNLPASASGSKLPIKVAVAFIFGAVAALFVVALREP